MSFLNHIKQVAPRLSLIKSRQPAILLGNKVIVAGIGGNFIPGVQSSSDSTSAAVADISAGYITVSDSVVTLHDITKGTTSIADKIYIPDTGVEEPEYLGGSQTGQSDCVDIDKSASLIIKFTSDSSIPSYAQSGHPITSLSSPTKTTQDGINCIYCNASGLRVLLPSFGYYYNNLDFAVSYWVKSAADISRDGLVFCSSRDYKAASNLAVGYSVGQQDGTVINGTAPQTGVWNHIVINSAEGICYYYINSTLVDQQNWLYTPNMDTDTRLFIGGVPPGWYRTLAYTLAENTPCYISNIRVFYKHISQEQILLLASELTPTAN